MNNVLGGIVRKVLEVVDRMAEDVSCRSGWNLKRKDMMNEGHDIPKRAMK